MKVHNGMRPQDVVILLKIIAMEGKEWQQRDISQQLFMSFSEVSESLNRSKIAGLIDHHKRHVYRQALMEFLEHGLHYVFPQQPGTLVTGMATSHSHPHYEQTIVSEMPFVWPFTEGNERGLGIQPLYRTVPQACLLDEKLYLLLASCDVIRVGKAREVKLAVDTLRNILL